MSNYQWLDDYCTSKKGATKDHKIEWEADRFMIKNKMFLMHGADNKGKEIITLKLEPMYGQLLREQYKSIIPGYYMNKEHWNSVYTDGSVPDDLLKSMIDKSYNLILSSFSKKIQAEILGNENLDNEK